MPGNSVTVRAPFRWIVVRAWRVFSDSNPMVVEFPVVKDVNRRHVTFNAAGLAFDRAMTLRGIRSVAVQAHGLVLRTGA